MSDYGIVDLFAGPGGLAEGFSGYQDPKGAFPFHVAFSIEKEQSAHSTLRLRSFLRQFGQEFPDEYYAFLKGKLSLGELAGKYPDEWSRAEREALNLELGTDEARAVMDNRLAELDGRRTIVIGGPPCQAYSLVGRSRNRGREDYVAENDARHFLYQEYIDTLEKLRPAAFVMENVKGLISSTVNGSLIGNRILSDLKKTCSAEGGYRLFPLADTKSLALNDAQLPDFVIRAERHGIPQARHRLIIVGIRADLCSDLELSDILSLRSAKEVSASSMLSTLPAVRSGLSQRDDSYENWHETVLEQMQLVARATARVDKAVSDEARRQLHEHKARKRPLARSAVSRSKLGNHVPAALRDWIVDPRLSHVPNHETRGHMVSDLGRYFFAGVHAKMHETSPKADDYPEELAPEHANWKSGKFADRFRVQLEGRPSTTITSHISKDGHYFIHPDPLQCRSLTVREAARLQTFPDNYVFLGNRTQQYVQVGNAVPPLLARQIADALHHALERIDGAACDSVPSRIAS
jgi:DNA (cytosine-5)-methyltransferase 1